MLHIPSFAACSKHTPVLKVGAELECKLLSVQVTARLMACLSNTWVTVRQTCICLVSPVAHRLPAWMLETCIGQRLGHLDIYFHWSQAL